MNSLSRKTFMTCLFAAMFVVFGFQTEANAQITVTNNTDCFIYFGVYEGSNCADICNQQETQLAPGGGFVIFNNSPCINTFPGGGNFMFAKYLASPTFINPSFTNFAASQGFTNNPAFNCYLPNLNAQCGAVIQPVWGPGTLTFQY